MINGKEIIIHVESGYNENQAWGEFWINLSYDGGKNMGTRCG